MTLCPKHQMELQPTPEVKGLCVCPYRGCDVNERVDTKRQMKIPGLDPGRQYKTLRVSEAALIKQWTQWGGLKGYTVFEVGQEVRYIRCPACHKAVKQVLCPCCQETFAPELFSQSTTGTPDTFWGRPEWGAWVVPIEAKKSKVAPVRQEQQRFVELGLSKLAWSLEMLDDILRTAEQDMKRIKGE